MAVLEALPGAGQRQPQAKNPAGCATIDWSARHEPARADAEAFRLTGPRQDLCARFQDGG
jgi:hypothetical protein